MTVKGEIVDYFVEGKKILCSECFQKSGAKSVKGSNGEERTLTRTAGETEYVITCDGCGSKIISTNLIM
ncbi:MAG: hypothetical protein ABID54_03255 [Pseudomonadota bacterium]